MLETLFNKIEYVIADKNEFVFPIPFLRPHNIRCYVLVGHGVKKLRIEEDFTVEKKENYRDGAIITLREAAHYAGKTLIIARIMLITQDLSLPYYSKIPSPSLERQMDKTIMICQQLREMLSRAILVPPGVEPNWEALMDLLTQAAADAKDAADRAQDILDQILDIPWDEYAPLDSPHFRGVPTAPTAGKGTDTDQLATTAFVQNEIEDFLVSVKVSFVKEQWISVEQAMESAGEAERKILNTALLPDDQKKMMFRIVTQMTDYSHVYKLVKQDELQEDDVPSNDGPYAVENCDSVEVRVMDEGYIMLLSAEAFDGYIYTIGRRLPVEYSYAKVDGGVAITGIKDNPAHWTDLTIPSSVQVGDEVLPVVEIGENAFAGNSVITSVVIGEGCRVIRSWAFSYCMSLTKLVLPNSMRTICSRFLYGAGVKELTLNEGLTTLKSSAFEGAPLTSLHIPASTTEIEEIALCTSDCPYTVAEENPKWKAVDGSVYSKDGRTLLRYGRKTPDEKTYTVLNGCTRCADFALAHLEFDSVTLPEGMLTIGTAFFRSYIKTLHLPATLTAVSDVAFRCKIDSITMTGNGNGGRFTLESGVLYDNTDHALMKCPPKAELLNGGQAEITVKEGVTKLCSGAFSECSMKSLDTNDVMTIKNDAFQSATIEKLNLGAALEDMATNISVNITEITVDASNQHFKAENNVLFTKDGTELVLYPSTKTDTSYTVPDSVKTIRAYAADDNKHLHTLALTHTETLLQGALSSLPILTSLNFGDRLASIDLFAIAHMQQLKSLDFPATLTHMSRDAVLNLPELVEVTFNGTGEWEMQGAFAQCPKLLTIWGHPGSSAEAYAHANNYLFKDIATKGK